MLFTADMTYGMLASGSCLLTDIVDQLHEDTKKVNSVERLTRHLNKGITDAALQSYLNTIRKWVPDEPEIHHIDDSDVVKPRLPLSHTRHLLPEKCTLPANRHEKSPDHSEQNSR